MSWYKEERDGPDKDYLEWCFGYELVSDEEPGFYKPKAKPKPKKKETKKT